MERIAFLALVLVYISFGESADFCERYARNGHKISFGYRRLDTNDDFQNYLFIGNTFWRLKYEDNLDDAKKIVSIDREKSGESNVFSAKYSMAFCSWVKENEDKAITGAHCRTGLMKPGSNIIEWVVVGNDLNLYKQLNSTSVEFEANFEPRLAFVSNSEQQKQRIVILIEKRPNIKALSYACNFNGVIKDGIKCNAKWPHTHIYERLNVSWDMTAILAQYSKKDWDNRPDGRPDTYLGHGSIILFNDNSVIKYCYTTLQDGNNDKQCTPDALKVLINCTESVAKVTTTEKTSTNVFIYAFILVVIAVLVILVIIALVIAIHKNLNSVKGNEETTLSNAFDITDKRSAISKITSKKAPKVSAPATGSSVKASPSKAIKPKASPSKPSSPTSPKSPTNTKK